jgi:plasmid replication initiation protein
MGKEKRMKPRTDVAIPERYVSMSNSLARGAQGLNLSQKRILAMAMAMTDSVPAKDLMDGQRNGWTVRLNAHDYAETYDVDIHTAYDQLKSGARSLLKTLWTTVRKEGRSTITTQGQWLSLAEYRKDEAVVDIRFHEKVAPHLLGLRKQFTTYKLKQASALRSIYAWRLFECLRSWKAKGRWIVDVEEFAKIMEAPPSCSKDFFNLNNRVIQPSLKELREKDNIEITLDLMKGGRKVTGLCFTFRTNPQGRLNV